MGHAAVRVVARAAGALADLSAIAALSLGVPSWTERGGWLEGTLVDADVFETRSSALVGELVQVTAAPALVAEVVTDGSVLVSGQVPGEPAWLAQVGVRREPEDAGHTLPGLLSPMGAVEASVRWARAAAVTPDPVGLARLTALVPGRAGPPTDAWDRFLTALGMPPAER
jgi:hypothetical protein